MEETHLVDAMGDNMFAIHSVFIAKENLLFLEQWIDYHIQIGFNKFFLYDNSKVVKAGGMHPKHKCFIPGKINKYNVNYDDLISLTNEEINTILKNITEKYDCVDIIEWSPKNKHKIVLHNQKEAHNHCLRRLKKSRVCWCANIDMDEYIVIKNNLDIQSYIDIILKKNKNISNIKLGQIRFESRFTNLDKLVIEITDAEKKNIGRDHSNKNMYNVANTDYTSVHSWKGRGIQILPKIGDIHFNHYKLTLAEHKIINNINPLLKEKILKNSENYITVPYVGK